MVSVRSRELTKELHISVPTITKLVQELSCVFFM